VDAGCRNERVAGRTGILVLDIPFHRRRAFNAGCSYASRPRVPITSTKRALPRAQGAPLLAAVPADRRDPASDGWKDVTCRNCLVGGFVEVSLHGWSVYAPKEAAETVEIR